MPTITSLSALVASTPKQTSQRTLPIYGDTTSIWNSSTRALERHVECLSALLLSLKKKPLIRYARTSQMSKKLGHELLVCRTP